MIDFHEYIGGSVRNLLNHPDIRNWSFERSEERDLPETVVYYLFPKHGLEIHCDEYDAVLSVFLYSKKLGGFNDTLTPVSLHDSRSGVLERYGEPVQSGEPREIPFLGKKGGWDRFEDGSRSTHFSYEVESSRIEVVTLMDRANVPK